MEVSDVVLGPAGLGVVSFGQSREETVPALQGRLGAADDSGYYCIPDEDVMWGQFGVTFSEGEFVNWLVRLGGDQDLGQDLTTAAGIGLGSTVEELRAAYGSSAEIVPGDELYGPRFLVSLEEGEFGGELSSMEPEGKVRSVAAGEPVCDLGDWPAPSSR